MKTTSVLVVGAAPSAVAARAVTGEIEAGDGSGALAKSAKSKLIQPLTILSDGRGYTIFISSRRSLIPTKKALEVVGHKWLS